MGIVYRLEYVHLEEKDKRVVRLMIDGQEYIDEAEARRDFIRSEEAGRNTRMLFCAAALGTGRAALAHALQAESDKRSVFRTVRSVTEASAPARAMRKRGRSSLCGFL